MEHKISDSVVEKYTEAYFEMCKRITSKRLVVMKFLRRNQLPNNFVTACTKLGFISSVKKGEFTVKVNVKSRAIGKAIAEKILEIENVRKSHFNQTNK